MLDTLAMLSEVRGKSEAELVAMFREARRDGARAWTQLALIVGELQAQTRYGDFFLEKTAKLLDVERSTVAELGQIAKGILVPRLGQGDLLIDEKAFYKVAIRAGATLNREPLEILHQAELRRKEDKKYSARTFKVELLGDSAKINMLPQGFWRKIKVLSRADERAIALAVHDVEPKSVIDSLTDARWVLDRAFSLITEKLA